MGKSYFPWAKAHICGGISPENRCAGGHSPGLVLKLRHRAFLPRRKPLPTMPQKQEEEKMRGFTTGAVSPCQFCNRVQDPGNCENKNCRVWQKWFLSRWALIRQSPRQAMDQMPLEPVGIPLGGRIYCHPNQRRNYIAHNPCDNCKCPQALCTGPCRVRRVWEEAKGEIPV